VVAEPALELDEATSVLEEAVAGAEELELEPLEDPDELDEDELEPLEDPDEPDDPDDPEPEEPEPDWFDPPSGSVYCWSPADGPDANATAGPATANAARRSSNPVIARVARTPRVCQLMQSQARR
jgi:hypothetical protein